MAKYLNFFEFESGFTEAVGAGELFYPNVSYTEDDDTVHWNLDRPANPVETPMLRMSFSTSSPGQEVRLRNGSGFGVTAMEIDGTPVNYASGGTYSIASPGNHTAVYQFASPAIPEMLFYSASGAFDTFTSAEITSAVTEIGNTAFAVCSGLSGVSISDSVTTIGVQAFAGSGLRSVTVPDSVTTLSGYPFFHCTEMRSATIGSGVTAIPYQTFAECTSLQSVTLPGDLTAIGPEAFRGCHSLYDISIPSGVTAINEHAFNGCSGLTAIYLNPETPPTLGTAALNNTNDCPIYVPAASVETYRQAWPGYASRIMPTGGGQYNITASVSDDTLGEVILDQQTATEGETVGFSVNVFDPVSSEVMVIQIHDENYNEVQYTDEGDGNYSFTMPASDVNVSAYIVDTGRHRITAQVNDSELGEVSIGQDSASEGEPVSFSVDVYDSETNGVTSVTVTDGNGDEVQCTNEFDNNYIFDMPDSDVTISVVIEAKPKYTVTVDSTDGFAENINFMSGDGEPSYREGENVAFSFNLIDSEMLQVVSVQASDCEGGSIEVTVEGDSGDYFCYFTMPGCDTSVFITIEENRQEYNITASVNDDSLGVVNVQETASEGEYVFVNVSVNDECRVTSLVITDAGGNELEHTDFVFGRYDCYFDMPASDVTIFATIEAKPMGQYHISVDLNDGSLGEVILFKETAQETANEGDTVLLQVNVFDPEHYRVGLVSVTDGNGAEVQVTDEDYDNYYSFTMPDSDVTISVVIEAIQ